MNSKIYNFLYNLVILSILAGMFYAIARDNQCTQEEFNLSVAQAFETYLDLEGYSDLPE